MGIKRKIALSLTVFMLAVLLTPALAWAGGDTGIEKAIKIARDKFEIPDKLDQFNYDIYNENGKQVWSLSWNSKDGTEGSIGVRLDELGNVLGYSNYKPYDYTKKQLPKVNRTDAQTIAGNFLKKIDAKLLPQLKYMENNQYTSMDYTYVFNYVRIVNGIPFYNNSVNVEVNRQTGEVQNYYNNWSDNLVFPSPAKAISISQAESIFKNELGLRLVYSYMQEDDKVKAYSAYSVKYNNYYIDAFTGKKVKLESGYYGPMYGGGEGDGSQYSMLKNADKKDESAQLTPQELKAVEEVSGLLTQDEAEKRARSIPALELDDSYVLNSANMWREWLFKDNFTWNLYFVKEKSEKSSENKSASIRVNAKTGEIIGFNLGYPSSGDNEKAQFDEKASRQAVEKFLNEFCPEKYGTTEYDENNETYYKPYGSTDTDLPRDYSFRYTRLVNKTAFPANSIIVGYDAVKGKVSSFDTTWYEIDFPEVDKVLLVDGIYDRLFKEIGLELQYKTEYPGDYYYKMEKTGLAKPEVRLVYGIKPEKPAFFDANTGVILNSNGQPYKEVKPIVYSDIAGNYAEKQISLLAEYGIALAGNEFRPGESIVQKDFFRLLSKVLSNYSFDSMENDDKVLEQIYAALKREGIVKDAEKSPDSVVTREEAVKYIIRTLKFDRVADIKGIFNCSFKDADSISPDLLGYVTIAQGLKIVSGSKGYFKPKAALSRAEAAAMIYNYLQN